MLGANNCKLALVDFTLIVDAILLLKKKKNRNEIVLYSSLLSDDAINFFRVVLNFFCGQIWLFEKIK